MTPDQILEAAKLVRKRELLMKQLGEIDGRLRKIGVEIPGETKGK